MPPSEDPDECCTGADGDAADPLEMDASSASSSSEDEEISWGKSTWVGKSLYHIDGDKYYQAMRSGNGETLSIGDCVHVKMKSTVAEVSPDDEVARIESMWEDAYKCKWVEARWFYWPRDTPHGKGTKAKQYGDRELFESDLVDELEPQCFNEKARVCFGEEAYRSLPREKLLDEVPTYYCRYIYSLKNKLVRQIRVIEPGLYSRRTKKQRGRNASSSSKIRAINAAAARVRPSEMSSPVPAPGTTGSASGTRFSQACAKLQLSAVPEKLPCREKERGKIMDFLLGAITRGGLGCPLYISGMPGTGKTATVHEVIRDLQRKVAQSKGKIPEFQFVEINGMKLPHPYNAYTHLYRALTGKQTNHVRAAQFLEHRFSTPSSRRPVCVVLVDELDYMVTRKQTVLYNLFDWPTRRHARLVVVGIANTMDLPERLLPPNTLPHGNGQSDL